MGRPRKNPFKKSVNPDVCSHRWVWMGQGAIRLEDGSVATRADKGGQPFHASWKWLAMKASLLTTQLITVEQYEARGGKLQHVED